MTFGIQRRLRRVDVLCPGLVTRFEGASGEGDHASALIRDGKRDPFAEAVVDRPILRLAVRISPYFLGAEKAAGAQRILIGRATQPVAQRVEAVRSVADTKSLDAFLREPAPGQIFSRQGACRRGQLLL